MSIKKGLVRITTVPISMDKLISGQLRFMSDYYQVTAISSDPEYLERIGRKEGVGTFSVEMSRKITPIQDIKAVIKLYRYLKKAKPLIVHTHTPKAGIVGMLAAKLAGVPVRLHTVAGLPLLEAAGAKRKLLDGIEKLTYSCATKVYPNSFGLLEIIKQHQYCPTNKLSVLANGSSNGIDTKYFSPAHFTEAGNDQLRQELGITKDDFVFVFVGRLVKDKGINELIAAFSELKQGDAKLLLVGSFEKDLDPLHPETIAQIKANNHIIHAGYQNDVRPYFAIADSLVFPSYREGFQNGVMQAGAMGLPAIVTNINGCNEIVKDRENGMIIPVKDKDRLREALSAMTDDKALYQKLQKNARPMVVARYEQKAVWEAILKEYHNFDNGIQ